MVSIHITTPETKIASTPLQLRRTNGVFSNIQRPQKDALSWQTEPKLHEAMQIMCNCLH